VKVVGVQFKIFVLVAQLGLDVTVEVKIPHLDYLYLSCSENF
jgi:hypothetical protein